MTHLANTTPKVEVLDAMTDEEFARLEELENIVRTNFGAFVQTGMALAEIRDRKLYRERFKTFEAYCKDTLEVSRSRAYRLIDSASVIQNLSPMGDILPKNERQVRPLTKLEPEIQIRAWQNVIDYTREKKKKPTANIINRIAQIYRGESIERGYRNAKERVSTESIVSTAFKKGFQAFLDVISEERNQGWKKTSKKAAIKHVETILDLIKQDD